MGKEIGIKRYSDIDLPEFRYIPGRKLKEGGPARRAQLPDLPPPVPLSAKSWQDSAHYLYAIDLFNYGYWWEAHEVLEGLWVLARRETPMGIFLQGLIQISASLLKESQSLHKPALSLAAKGIPKIRTKSGIFLGLKIESFLKETEAFLSGQNPSPPLILLDGV